MPLNPMFTLDDKYRATNKDSVFEVMREQQNQKLNHKRNIFKFPCHDVSIELTKPEDTYVECPTCHKKYLMTFSANRSKLWSA